jgi:RimJ/RimL family protein N-acetyltransferase
MTILHTERLRLEPITDRHYDGMRRMSADPEVMRFLNKGKPQTDEETRAGIERIKRRWEEWGYSWWALIETGSGDMVGAACLQHLALEDANPLEIGWRLTRDSWGKGYASEAARSIVRHAFDIVGVDVVLAVAHPDNAASIKVMQRLGMQYVGIETHYDMPCVVYQLMRASHSRGSTR